MNGWLKDDQQMIDGWLIGVGSWMIDGWLVVDDWWMVDWWIVDEDAAAASAAAAAAAAAADDDDIINKFSNLWTGGNHYYSVVKCQSVKARFGWQPGVGTPILGYGRELSLWWSQFVGFSIWLGPCFIQQHNPIDPLFLQTKNRFISITFSSRDTRTYIWSIFSQKCFINSF